MNGADNNPVPENLAEKESRVAPEAPEAESKKSGWPGWIWSIPIAAVLIVAWLAFRQITAQGALVTVIFPKAEGISANQTTVVYQGMTVGQVESVHFEKDLSHVKVQIRMDSEMEGHLGKGTEFWVNTPKLTDLTSIRSIIGGPSIGIAPVSGEKQGQYQGLAEAPVTPESVPGTHYLLHASELGTVARGSQIYFHGLDVGAVGDVTLEPNRHFLIGIFIKEPYDRLVHRNTRFWNAGAVQVSLQGAGPRLQFQSLPALVNGAVDFETPAEQGASAPAGYNFALYRNESAAEYAPGPFSVIYNVAFGPGAGGLDKGAAVTLAGTRIGTVEKARLQFDPASGALQERVLLAIEPTRIALPAGAKRPPHGGRAAMDALMNRLIKQGLRAEAGSSIPLVGSPNVELAFVEPPSSASLAPGDPPEIPSVRGGSGIGGIMKAVSAVTSKVENLPLDQIADNLKTVTGRAAALSTSGKLSQSLNDLHSAIANLKTASASAKTDVPALLAALRQVASEADRTVASAHQLINVAAGTGPTGLNTASLGQTLYQINRAAAAVRQLVDYLDRHPSALIRGRR